MSGGVDLSSELRHPFACASRSSSLRAQSLPFLFTSLPEMSAPKAIVAPSMLSCDFSFLANEANRMCKCGADWLHMDVMVRRLLLLLCGSLCIPIFVAYFLQDGYRSRRESP